MTPVETTKPGISVVLPVYNEEACIEATVRELYERLSAANVGVFETLAVNDGSTDGTEAVLRRLAAELPNLRLVRLEPHAGQSAGMGAGFRLARGAVVVTMDADGQNDPADIPRCLAELGRADACFGFRACRQDRWTRRVGSRLANRVRNRALGENIVDTGCSLKAIRVEFVRDLMIWNGMHRFLGSLLAMRGARIAQIAVNHRPRTRGQTKYTNLGRLRKTVWDLLAVRWMKARCPRFDARELTP